MKRIHILFILLLVFSLVALLLSLLIEYRQNLIQQDEFYKSHILGGFSIDTPQKAANAAADGIQVTFKYGQPPSEDDSLGQKLQALDMKVIDGYISSYLYYYECHRTAELKPSLLGPSQYCQKDPYPSLTDENVLLAAVATHLKMPYRILCNGTFQKSQEARPGLGLASSRCTSLHNNRYGVHLKQVKDNPLIIGYWVLDDWVQWDAGSARPVLIKIHKLIQQYTPGRPTICGFGGSIGLRQEYAWADWIADNFSPQGCDKVGFYIYTSSLSDTISAGAPNTYNWSMSGVLSAMFASLQQRGWAMTREPLIGIVQAFGGPTAHTDRYWVTPTARDVETQSRSFCEHGASGLTFYTWDGSGYGTESQTPMNSPQIQMGIRNGTAACKAYWARHLQKSSQVSQEIL